MAVMKEIGAKCLVDMADYTSNNPQFIVNGFLHLAILKPWTERLTMTHLYPTQMKLKVNLMMKRKMLVMMKAIPLLIT